MSLPIVFCVLLMIAVALCAAAAPPTPPSERLVGIAYTTWHKNVHWENTWGTPLLGSYASDDRNVIRQHAMWLADAGVDFVWVDWSNDIGYTYDPLKKRPDFDMIEGATFTLFDELAKMRAEGKKTPNVSIFAGVTGAPEAAGDGRLQRKADQIWDQFVANPVYRPLVQTYLGKPLLVVYVNTPSPFPDGAPAWTDPRFSVRWMTGYVTEQRRLRTDDLVSKFGYWSWEDRRPQTYSVHDGGPEAMVVVASWREQTGQGPDGRGVGFIPAAPRSQGDTFRRQWARAREIGPKFALVVSWNEWHRGEQPSPDVSKDIEPSQEFGSLYLDLMKQEIAKFRAGRGRKQYATPDMKTLTLVLMLGALLCAVSANAQTLTVDFSRWGGGPPLVKTKFGVYQTPLIGQAPLMKSLPLLREINVQDLRYEMGWGKPGALAFDQIGGTAARPKIDFAFLDDFTAGLTAQGVRSLFAMGYCPNPLKSRTDWPAWKDKPNDLEVWRVINQAYAAHLKQKPRLGASYEVWNEPDIPDPGGKMFFTGGPPEYQQLYHAAAAGVRAGDPDGLVGGAATAYDLRFLTPILSEPIDFASIHSYDNFAPQLAAVRGALGDKPRLPIYLTEYASFTQFGPRAPVSRHPAAARFFRDVKGMLAETDLAKVYWAQWVDDGLGMITSDGHRKALFNAFKVYGMMPVDRNMVTPDGAEGAGGLASSDGHNAAVVIWNESSTDRPVTVRLKHLPFARGALQVSRIDVDHASWVDNRASENLAVLQTSPVQGASAVWTGMVPAESVVFLMASDGTGQALLRPIRFGSFVRSHGWYRDRNAPAYADYDPRTAIARLGMGDADLGIAQTGAEIDEPPHAFTVQVKKQGPFKSQDVNSLFGLRVDFRSKTGRYTRSVLYHDGLYNPRRDAPLPWGKGGAVPDAARLRKEMTTGAPFRIDLTEIAPPDWDRKRILLSFVLQNAGRDAQARLVLEPA